MHRFLFSLLIAPLSAWALDLSPHPQWGSTQDIYNKSDEVETRESVVNIDGVRFREIRVKSELYYMRLLNAEAPAAEEQIYCLQRGKLPEKTSPPLVQGEVQVTHRTTLFIEGLRTRCQQVKDWNQFEAGIKFYNKKGDRAVVLNPAGLKAGVEFSHKDGSKSQVNVNPKGAGAALDW